MIALTGSVIVRYGRLINILNMIILIVTAATILPFDPCKLHILWSYLGALLQVLLLWVVLESGQEGLERARAPVNTQNKPLKLQ